MEEWPTSLLRALNNDLEEEGFSENLLRKTAKKVEATLYDNNFEDISKVPKEYQ